MWDWGIATGVIGVVGVALIPATAVFSMAASTPGEFRLIRAGFILSAILLSATTFATLWFYPEGPAIVRIGAAAVVGALIFGGLAAAFQWVDRKQEASMSGTDDSGFPGGRGGKAKAEDGGKARGGKGGAAGTLGRGGDGGAAEAKGKGSGALGGEGGEGARHDRASRGGRGPLDVLNDHRRDMIVPGTNMRLGDFGRGGDSADPTKQKKD